MGTFVPVTYPSAWTRYRKSVLPETVSPQIGTAINRFAARYRFAASFRGLDVTGIAQRTVDGYAQGLRLTLAYSALEGAEKFAGKSTQILEVRAAAALRADEPLMVLVLEEEQLGRSLEKRLRGFHEDPSDQDIRPVVERIRHLVAHGAFTPHAAGLSDSVRRTRLFDLMSLGTLASADEAFSQWFDRQVRG